VSRKRKEVDLEKNSDPEGVFYRFLRRVCPETMLRIMFPECNIEIRLDPAVNSPDEAIHIKSDQNQFDLLKGKK